MKLDPIVMDKQAAQRAFIEYRNAVRARHSDEDAEIMRGYKALAKGLQLIKLSEAVKAGGLVDGVIREWRGPAKTVVDLPRIAVVRASATHCFVRTHTNGAITFTEKEEWPSSNARINVRRFGAGTLGETIRESGRTFRAIAPTVPPRFRPNASLSNYHVLFEAEWEPVVPKDPALLRHIGGDLYAVLAVWDLSEIERAVLARRAQ